MVESAAASSKVVFMVRPNSSTKKIELSRASNGDIITGSRDDVSTLQVEKQYDLRVVSEAIQRFEERMSYAFLLNSAVQRDADRVTAEEIRYMANELETALGGVYSLLGNHEIMNVQGNLNYVSYKGLEQFKDEKKSKNR